MGYTGRELARDKRVALFARAIQGIINDQTSHYISVDTIEEEVKQIICPLLDAFEREMKIDEAKAIEELFDRCTDTRQFAGTLDRHIFELAAQPTPEVKK